MRGSFWLCLMLGFTACGRDALPLPVDGEGSALTSCWSMIGGGPMHQSRNLGAPRSPQIAQSWDFQANGVVRGSCVCAADGSVYFVTTPTEAIHSPATLYALTAAGQPKWQLPVATSYQASPAVGADGTVYVGDGASFDAFTPTGEIKWRLALGETVLSSPTLGADGTIYFTTTQSEVRGALHAVSPEGTLLWTSSDGDRVVRSSSPAILPDGTLATMQVSVYVGQVDGYSPIDGSHLFTQPHGYVDPYNVFPVVGKDGALYVSTDEGIQVFDSAGQPSKVRLPGGSADAPATVGSDGTVYGEGAVGEGWWEVEATHPDGTRAWSLKDVSAMTFAMGSNGILYAAGERQLYAIAPNGTLAKPPGNDLGSRITSLLALDANDNVLFGTADGKVHARGF